MTLKKSKKTNLPVYEQLKEENRKMNCIDLKEEGFKKRIQRKIDRTYNRWWKTTIKKQNKVYETLFDLNQNIDLKQLL